MKIFINLIGTMLIAGFVSIACIGSYKSHDYSMEFKPQAVNEEVIILHPDATEFQPMSEVPLARTSQFVNLTFEEMDLLERIAMAEARGEGSVGMAYVMRVVLNRSLKNGTSIRDTIYARGQFYTAGMNIEPSDECHEALAMIIDGWDESQGALYFCATGYNGKTPLFKYGGHYFSK